MHYESQWLGETPYEDALRLQHQVHDKIRRSQQPLGAILGCEHPPVITQGISTRRQHVGDLAQVCEIPVHKTVRGGQLTLHSPGQLLIYPIWPVRDIGVRSFVQNLLQTTTRLLQGANLDVHTDDSKAPGLYLGARKICFIGLKISQGVSYHGLAINVSNDLSLFSRIVPCGVRGQPMISLAEMGLNTSCAELFGDWNEEWRHQLTSKVAREST